MYAYQETYPDRANSDLFVLSVCTRRRPEMLNRCLQSMRHLNTPDGWRVEIVVIENDSLPRSKGIVEEYAGTLPFNITYRHEPDLGIPQARNHAINYALEKGAEYLGFIDDDEEFSNNWLEVIRNTFETSPCDVVHGAVVLNYEQHARHNIIKRRKKNGTWQRTASTDNIAFHRRIIAPKPEGMELRFNEKRRFTGGSDTEFFFSATDKGAKILWTEEAWIYENVPEGRTRWSWLFSRSYRTEANASHIYRQRKGYVKALIKYTPKILSKSVATILCLPLLLMLSVIDKPTFSNLSLTCLKYIASALGAIAGLLSIQPEPYK